MPDQTTEAIKERIDIVALISESLPLKRAGSHFKAKCPFHEETAASFTVSPTRQTFRCFGCNKGGDIFTWLMEREGMSFPEAVRVLAPRAGVPLTFDRPERREERERLRATLDLAATFYHRILLETTEGNAPRAYLEGRGLTSETIAAWRLGYCPPGSSPLTQKASERGVTTGDLVSAGILGEREQRTFEFFHGRILFPLLDTHGSVIGLAGRVFGAERPEAPKYLNTRETLLYRKSAVLYGLDQAKDAIRKDNLAVLVEGYTDVIASHQAAQTNVVATAGTALTEDHLALLRRFADRLAFAFDPDAAGETATRRALDLALNAGFTVSVVSLPAGEDPAELAVRDAAAWRQAIAARRDVFAVLLDRARGRSDLGSPEGKKAAAADLLPVIARVSDAVVQGDYAQQLAGVLGVDPRFVYDGLHRLARQPGAGHQEPNTSRQFPVSRSPFQGAPVEPQIQREERFLILLLAEPSLLPLVASELPAEAIVGTHTRALYAALCARYTGPHVTHGPTVSVLAELRASLPPDLQQSLDALLFSLEVERERDEWEPVTEAEALLRVLLGTHVRRELQRRTAVLRDVPPAERTAALRAVADMTASLARVDALSLRRKE